MNTYSKIIAASVLSVAAFAGIANAATYGTDVSIVRIDSIASDSARHDMEALSPATIRSAQQTVASNGHLKQELLGQGVELDNVVSVRHAADGGAVVYLR